MKKITRILTLAALSCAALAPATASAQLNLSKAVKAVSKTAQGVTLTDEKMAEYVRQSVAEMDKLNKVSASDSKYTQRLNRLTQGIKDINGIPLNFKVYEVIDVNAFACPDGSVRVFSSLMDIMDDDELLGVIGHEIGHVGMHHSKKAFRTQLLTGALRDAVSATGGLAGKLTDSQLGALGESLVNAKYSQKQEKEADNAGYDFLVKNGRNPWGMAMAFEKLDSISGHQQGSYIQKMFSSHPDTQSRIKAIQTRCKKDGYTRPAK